MSNRSKEAYKDENAQLKKRIKELEKALSFSKRGCKLNCVSKE